MRRIIVASAGLMFTFSLCALSGCGEDKKVDVIVDSPESKKADAAAQDGMKAFMQSKTQAKPGAKK